MLHRLVHHGVLRCTPCCIAFRTLLHRLSHLAASRAKADCLTRKEISIQSCLDFAFSLLFFAFEYIFEIFCVA